MMFWEFDYRLLMVGYYAKINVITKTYIMNFWRAQMKVYIAEKKNVADVMAEYLFGKGYSSYKNARYYKKGETVVTWAMGHILEMAMPSHYGVESFTEYPIFPEKWVNLPSSKGQARDQLKAVGELLKTADVVVNGGDPDREGQLLIDEILVYFKYKGATERIYIQAWDHDSVKKAFNSIIQYKLDGNDMCGFMYKAGYCRERADWLVGLNLSRACTVQARKQHINDTFRIGRVMTPTLALVVRREEEIRNFKKQNYYEMSGVFKKDGTGKAFRARHITGGDLPVDSEGRVLDKNVLSIVMGKVTGREGKVTKCVRKNGKEAPPLPYSLDTLQVEANRSLGFSPKVVLDTAQSLYEKKLTSYPRSDCNYIPSSQHADGTKILKVLDGYGIPGAAEGSVDNESRTFDDKKVTAHHAIIPTGEIPKDLDDKEAALYKMIASRYVLQYLPPCEFEKMEFEVTVVGELFRGSGKLIKKEGFRKFFRNQEKPEGGEEEQSDLPDIREGDMVTGTYEIEEKETKPPKRFTEGTLLAAMTNIWRFVDPKNPNREKLKEVKGIGTPATRDSIIAKLLLDTLYKADGTPYKITPMLRKEKKELVPTDFGRTVIRNVAESLTKPDLTAVMEMALTEIAEGKRDPEEYMRNVEEMVRETIRYAEERQYEDLRKTEPLKTYLCPVCGKPLVQVYSKASGKHLWLCKGCEEATGKPRFFDDNKNAPFIPKCPKCGTILKRLKRKDGSGFFWLCEKCEGKDKFYEDNNGKPVLKKTAKTAGDNGAKGKGRVRTLKKKG